jgi:hypothetical protein
MRVTTVNHSDASDYDRFVDEAEGGHFAQTRSWGRVATSIAPAAVKHYLVREGDRIVGAAAVQRPRFGLSLPVAKIDRGPVCADPEMVGPVLRALWKKLPLLRLQVMPYWAGERAARVTNALGAAGFKDVQAKGGSHVVTLRIDLRPSMEEIVAGDERATLRKKIKESVKAKATARAHQDGGPLHDLYQGMMAAQGLRGRPRAWFDALAAQPRAGLFVCEHQGRIVSAMAAVRHGTIATFLVGATSQDKTTFSKMIPALMEAIRWARESGCAIFDMGGVPMAEDDDPKRAQIAQFKLHFAKKTVALVREHARVRFLP